MVGAVSNIHVSGLVDIHTMRPGQTTFQRFSIRSISLFAVSHKGVDLPGPSANDPDGVTFGIDQIDISVRAQSPGAAIRHT